MSTVVKMIAWVAVAGFFCATSAAEAGLLAHWTFDEGAGTTVTDSVNGNVGTLQDNTSFSANTPSGGGWSMLFDGTNDRIVVPDSPSVSPTGNITLSAWINASSFAGGARNILAKDSNNAYRWRNEANDGEPWLLINDGGGLVTYFSGATVPTGGWHHMAVTAEFAGHTANFYLDGVLVGRNNLMPKTGIANTGGALVIGAYNTGGAESFNGNIDEVAMWDEVLAPNQIAALAAGTAPNAIPAAPPSGFTFRPFGGTSDSDLHWTKTYTHAANVRGTPVNIYGVSFETGDTSGTNWTLNGTSSTYDGAGAGGIFGHAGNLVNNFRYGPGSGSPQLTLTGLTPGERYLTTWYNSSWGAPGGRLTGISASDGGYIAFDENFTDGRNGNLLQYEYVAPATGTITYTFENANDTYHHYAFTNESLDAVPAPTDPTFKTAVLTGDGDTGIAVNKLYTHAVNFNGGPMIPVNGVLFQGTGENGPNIATTNLNGAYAGNTNPVTGNMGTILETFRYHPAANAAETITLTGLLPGQAYVATFYDTAFGAPGERVIDIATSQGHTFTFDQNYTGIPNNQTGRGGNLLRHEYIADSTSITFSFTPRGTNASAHQYALTNEMAGEPNMHLDPIAPFKQVLLTDSFNSGVNDFNVSTNVAARQMGLLAPLTYTEIGPDYGQQVGNTGNHHPNDLLLADAGFVGINHNFNGEFSDGGLIISFDLDPSWDQGDTWGAITLGADDHNHNGWVNRPETHFGILFRGNGGIQAFDGSIDVTGGAASWGALAGAMHHFDIVLTDTVNANPFDGYGTTVIDVLVDGNSTPVFSFVKGDGGYLNNYVGFQGYWRAEFDNLVISQIIPEPTTLSLTALGLAALARSRRRRR